MVPKPQAVSESESPVVVAASADFLFSGDLSTGADALLRKSCGRLDFLFLIEALFGGGILLVSFCSGTTGKKPRGKVEGPKKKTH